MINTCVEVAEVFTKYGLVKPPVTDSRRISISVIVRSSRYPDLCFDTISYLHFDVAHWLHSAMLTGMRPQVVTSSVSSGNM